MVRIFPHSYWIFSPNAEKYGPEKTPYLDTLHAVDRWTGRIKANNLLLKTSNDLEFKLSDLN